MKVRMSKPFANLNDARNFLDKVIDGLAIKNCLQVDDDGLVYTAWDNQSNVWMSREFRVTGDHTFVVTAETDKVLRLYDLYIS